MILELFHYGLSKSQLFEENFMFFFIVDGNITNNLVIFCIKINA